MSQLVKETQSCHRINNIWNKQNLRRDLHKLQKDTASQTMTRCKHSIHKMKDRYFSSIFVVHR